MFETFQAMFPTIATLEAKSRSCTIIERRKEKLTMSNEDACVGSRTCITFYTIPFFLASILLRDDSRIFGASFISPISLMLNSLFNYCVETPPSIQSVIPRIGNYHFYSLRISAFDISTCTHFHLHIPAHKGALPAVQSLQASILLL